ncbi:MAG: hypothetical protein K5644_04360 [Lachnospiraceae bacterium]|nr:hypothetical protein [Lachnospiraceae bacterium]
MSDVQASRSTSDFEYILDYSGFIGEEKDKYIKVFTAYAKTYKNFRRDKDADKLRKWINNAYYDIYKKCFMRAVNDRSLPDTIRMFLNFGYMDGSFLTDEMVDGVYNVSNQLAQICSEHVFTIFSWLKAIYRGDKEPSHNEFDLDFAGYLNEQYRNGEIKKSDIELILNRPEERAAFEIDNMFKTVNRLTYGSITSFNAILTDLDLVNNPAKMLVTNGRCYKSIDMIRSIDYSAFYRPLFSYPLKDNLQHEIIQKAFLPDIILMPNVGNRGMMWQESASVHNDTPARFMLPIFTMSNMDDLMIDLIGRFRWEICRKIQGVRWNDIREHSLTSDYYDYLQFYKTNRELSAEAKEKVKQEITNARNEYRDVFVADYINWIKYESMGGFRLNKYARRIMFKYCPFSKDIREKLNDNPVYTDIIHKHEVLSAKTHKRIQGMYDIYTKNGGTITTDLKTHIDFYEL